MSDTGNKQELGISIMPVNKELTLNTQPPYHESGQYSDEEIRNLTEFMHSAGSVWSIGGGRHGILSIERSPESIMNRDKWDRCMEIGISPEWEELHPKLRQKNIYVRFQPSIGINGKPMATALDFPKTGSMERGEVWIRVATQKNGVDRSQMEIFLDLAHELAETDYYAKKPLGLPRHFSQEDDAGTDLDYWNLEDEKVANRRSLRALQRIDPTMTADKVWKEEFIYPEDRV
jgi:hypothetical protein